jgi:hypothetical protein
VSDYITLVHDGVKLESENAVLFWFSDRAVWIPRSLMDGYSDEKRYVEVRSWFAIEEGLEAYEA